MLTPLSFDIDAEVNGEPGDHWSEFAYMVNYLKANLNDTDIVSGGSGGSNFWDSVCFPRGYAPSGLPR